MAHAVRPTRTRRVVTVDQAAAELRAAQPDRCWCPTGPTTIARWIASELVTVEHRHLITCGRPSTWTPPREYAPVIRSAAPRGGWR